jgi:hypothetical protein
MEIAQCSSTLPARAARQGWNPVSISAACGGSAFSSVNRTWSVQLSGVFAFASARARHQKIFALVGGIAVGASLLSAWLRNDVLGLGTVLEQLLIDPISRLSQILFCLSKP